MHRLLVLYPPPSDPDHFRSYYEDTHLPLVAKLPGLRAYRYSFDVAAGEGESPYYCVFEADFDDAAAYSAALESPEGQAVRADVPNYATGGGVVLNYELGDLATAPRQSPVSVRAGQRRIVRATNATTHFRLRLQDSSEAPRRCRSTPETTRTRPTIGECTTSRNTRTLPP